MANLQFLHILWVPFPLEGTTILQIYIYNINITTLIIMVLWYNIIFCIEMKSLGYKKQTSITIIRLYS